MDFTMIDNQITFDYLLPEGLPDFEHFSVNRGSLFHPLPGGIVRAIPMAQPPELEIVQVVHVVVVGRTVRNGRVGVADRDAFFRVDMIDPEDVDLDRTPQFVIDVARQAADTYRRILQP